MKNILAILCVLTCSVAFSAQDDKGDHNSDGHSDNGKADFPAIKDVTDKYDADVAKLTKELVKSLQKVQEDETKKGNLDCALHARNLITAYSSGTPVPVRKPAKPVVAKTTDLTDGTYDFALNNGHANKVIVKGDQVSYDNFTGTITKGENGWSIAWSNHTTWAIKPSANGAFSLVAPDGSGTLVPTP